MERLRGKVALVTGGASGIGEATVRLFVDEGASMVLADLQDERGRSVAKDAGPRAVYVHADVSREADVAAMVDETVRRFGRLDCLFNNAGFAGVHGPIDEIGVEGFDATIAVLLRGVFLGMKHAAAVMKRQGTGSIISTASVAGLHTGLGPHIYSAAKAAVIHLTRSVAMELGERGVRVNCICPGGIATPIFGKSFGLSPDQAETTIPLMKGVLETLQPIRRPGLPEDIAHAVFLAAASQRSKRIRLGHGIVLMPPAYNPPARVAERLATLDLVSGGRVDWGTGESASRAELEGFGIDPNERRAMWRETVEQVANMMVMDPYPGFSGKYFSMPVRNVLPKPVQKPHPPIWVACSNRETIHLAAQLGIGALTFAFIDPSEARHWVADYYETFKRECVPIGHAVNPNIAMVTGFSCHVDAAEAGRRGNDGFRFFQFALAYHYVFGTHTPGRTNIWNQYLAVRDQIGTELLGPAAGSTAHPALLHGSLGR